MLTVWKSLAKNFVHVPKSAIVTARTFSALRIRFIFAELEFDDMLLKVLSPLLADMISLNGAMAVNKK